MSEWSHDMAESSGDEVESVTRSTSVESDNAVAGESAMDESLKRLHDIGGFGNQNEWKTMHVSINLAGKSDFMDPPEDLVLNASCVGHRASQGVLRTAYIGMAIGLINFVVAFDVPPPPTQPDEEPTPTIVQQCIDLYVNKSFEKLIRFLVPTCNPLFEEKLADPPTTLESVLERGLVSIRITSADEETVIFEPYPEVFPEKERIDWVSLKGDLVNVPVFELSEVENFRIGGNGHVYQVSIKGKTFLYKPAKALGPLAREISMLQKVVGCSLRVPKVEGILGINTKYSGILITFIPSSFTLSHWTAFEASVAERQKWYDQVSETIRILHKNDCCWGDAKDENIVIDKNRDAWLVDFEGGYSPGWVDVELRNTFAGDLQALSRLPRSLRLCD
ncbi:hypothetical protein BO70DRAFT_163617 [Aspergillus heteromorphus CBS 117.55]|uniref:Protein kinase domain-containing protein n=1 Tax=Aspergillus heteromorphus CBS 117.55 TaxID=1448321 RepID=A0A317WWR1_9EURO|nr:uncharacterized protein BO70DRAFT_163617 [Aspergillus heteromorphus CBS 117.55]PWY89248.1 hypothetical protein BO70DRAFT_163617 [Aspergillus heteromorphus CBS 117.55]